MIPIDIENKNLWLLFEFHGEKIYLTESMVSTWVVMLILIILAIVVRIKLNFFKDKPSGLQNIIEIAIESIDNLVKSTMGEKLEFLSGYFFSIFAFILFANYIGLVGLRPPTTDLAVTLPLALSTFILIHCLGIAMQKGGYFKDYLRPNPVFLPLNIIGEFAKPLSLSFRLFGNMFGGFIIVQLVYSMLPFFLRFILPDIVHVYFDIFAGALQAFVFTMLSMSFIKLKAIND